MIFDRLMPSVMIFLVGLLAALTIDKRFELHVIIVLLVSLSVQFHSEVRVRWYVTAWGIVLLAGIGIVQMLFGSWANQIHLLMTVVITFLCINGMDARKQEDLKMASGDGKEVKVSDN